MSIKRYTLSGLAALLSLFSALPTVAQIQPDETLGAGRSLVTEDAVVRGELSDLIEGGAVRGGNLFHSFLEFNVDEGQRVYFANPVGIESILSRVTGENPSNIFGLLGVDGGADLFLMNPNGIVFGEAATFDIEGSFYGTTGDAVKLGNEVFSAVEPESSRLLHVSPSILLENYLSEDSGDIESRGQLAVLGDLVLAGNGLDLQGQVAAGDDLTLLGLYEVRIRDTEETPFIGFTGGDLLVQGNQQVDIVALSHPDSGLFAYGDMALRSASTVIGDAYFLSGGNFRVGNLEKMPGQLGSEVDPIIRSLGDVEFESYLGSSLHVIAGGSVSFNEAVVTAPDPGTQGIDFLQETVELTDGTLVEIDGGAQPTVDIRAGVSPDAVGVLPIPNPSGLAASDLFIDNVFQPVDPTLTATPSGADIEVGSIRIDAPNGLIFLTNRYEPNTTLPDGDIRVVGNDPFGLGFTKLGINMTAAETGSIFLDSRGDIDVTDTDITLLGSESTGDIVLLAEEDVVLEDLGSFIFSGIANNIDIGGQGTAGDIRITARNLSLLNGAQIDGRLFGSGEAGDITIDVEDTALLQGVNPVTGLSSGVAGLISAGVQGTTGDVKITAQNLLVLEGAQINTSSFGLGEAGDVRLEIRETIRFAGLSTLTFARSGVSSNVQAGSMGEAGDIYIEANNFELLDGATLRSSTFGIGDAGSITLNIRETARFDSNDSVVNFSGVFTDVQPNSQGRGGEIRIEARNLDVLGGSVLSTSNFGGAGAAGSIVLDVRETVRFEQTSELTSEYAQGATTGDGGDIQVTAESLEIDNSLISARSEGAGNAGNILITTRDDIQARNGSIATNSAFNAGGQIQISSGTIFLLEDSDIQTFVNSGVNSGGDIEIIADALIALDDSDILAFASDGRGGEIDLSQATLFSENLSPTTDNLTREELFALDGNGQVDINATGGIASGDIFINDASFVENSINELSGELVDTTALTAGSCISRSSGDRTGSFVVTGSEGLPQQPVTDPLAVYPTDEIQSPRTSTTTPTIQEAHGVYQLTDGRLVLSHDCGR